MQQRGEVHLHEFDERAEVQQLSAAVEAQHETSQQGNAAKRQNMLRGIAVRRLVTPKKRRGGALSRPMPCGNLHNGLFGMPLDDGAVDATEDSVFLSEFTKYRQ